jgi:hypothetical protein
MGEGRISIMIFWLSGLMPFGFLVSRLFSLKWRLPAGISAAILIFLLVRISAWHFLHQPFGF